MADQPAKNTTKRRVKNPETFRERAIKASVESEQPTKRHRVRKASSAVGRPIGRVSRKIFDRQPFRFIGKILRFIGRIIFPAYFRNSWRELKQVTWPTWRQSRQLTFAVLAFAIVFGAIVAGVDYGLDKLFRNILLK